MEVARMNRQDGGPPVLDGYTAVKLIGRGGHADVYAYTQHTPRRTVAVKVLADRAEDASTADAFAHEANILADLSHHPSIVTVYQAGVSADGRPFIVMEHCSRPSLGTRYRRERLSVPETLRAGVRLSSAVETAHRAGILHRDIKPANVLVTDFGWPALADFGIATAHGEEVVTGLSIPWAAPEVLAGSEGDTRTDIYSLGATVYALLAQRSPFETPGGNNKPFELMNRIQRGGPPPTGRADVPASLEAILQRAMGHRDRRYASAADLGRALQQVEAELALPVTELDLPDFARDAPAWMARAQSTAADSTRHRPITAMPSLGLGAADATRVRPVSLPIPDSSATSSANTVEPLSDINALVAPHASRRKPPVVAGIVAGTLLVAAGATAFFLSRDPEPGPDPTPTTPVAMPVMAPTPINLTAVRDGEQVTFTWVNPEQLDGDTYYYVPQVDGVVGQAAVLDEPTVTLTAPEQEQVCIQVMIVRASGVRSQTPGEVCDQ